MKAVVVFYSYTGRTKEIAEQRARELGADLLEVRERKARGTASAYIAGSFAAMRQKKARLTRETADLSAYDRIVIAVPVWAGSPAPPFNNIVDWLPAEKEVELILTSGSGSSANSASRTKAMINDRKCRVVSYSDRKTS